MDEKNTSKISIIKIIIASVAGIVFISIVVTICISLYRDRASVDSILSILLAFFSMFISIFFYFKADETSSKFYNNSYEFMKDISVTLGKIEERFGEKLNMVTEKLTHLESAKAKTGEELRNMEDEKQLMQNLIERANLGREEKQKYEETLYRKDKEIEALKTRQTMQQEKYNEMVKRFNSYSHNLYMNNDLEKLIDDVSENDISILLKAKTINDLSPRMRILARELNLINPDGSLKEARGKMLHNIITRVSA